MAFEFLTIIDNPGVLDTSLIFLNIYKMASKKFNSTFSLLIFLPGTLIDQMYYKC